MKLAVNTLIFDFDGVIADTGADIANAVNHTLVQFGRPELSSEEVISYVGRGAKELIRSCLKGSDDETIANALSYYMKYYLDNCIVKTRLYNNVEETLNYFKDKKIALLTNKPEALTRKILEGFGIIKNFKLIIGPESVNKLKPDPEGILKVLSALDETPENAIMIGDTYTDVEVGKNAGTFTCGVTYGLGDTGALVEAAPDLVINDIKELVSLIE